MQSRSDGAREGHGWASAVAFFLLVFALSVPFWIFGALVEWEPLPGLPVSALMAFTPMIAALILARRSQGRGGAWALLKRSFDFRRIQAKVWYIPVILLTPAMLVAQYAWMRATGVELPPIQVPLWVPLLMLAAFFVGGLGEELGWSGYAIDPLQDRWGALRAAIILGVIWALWHIIPFLQAGRGAEWIAWKCLGMVATRVIMVWLFNNTGKSVFAATLYHAMDNVSAFLFPSYGSHLDPRLSAIVLVAVAAVVVATSDTRTLTRIEARSRT